MLKFILRSFKKIFRMIKKGKNKIKKKSSSDYPKTTPFDDFMTYFAANLQSAHKMWGRHFSLI